MPNSDSPYGGRIIARMDGSVLYQISAREFKENRNIDGTLEYAIRRAVSSRTILPSLDSKCLVQVYGECPVQAQEDVLSAKFLIVSGYEAPEAKDDALLIGKAYYVTADAPQKNLTNQERLVEQPIVPLYNLSLRYDDYDIERANLLSLAAQRAQRLRFDVEPERLSLCYQHWYIALIDPILNERIANPAEDLPGLKAAKEVLRKEREMQREAAALDFDRAKALRAKIESLRAVPGGLPQVAWVSEWRRVCERKHPCPDVELSPSTDAAAAVAPDDEPITAAEIFCTPGSRTITALGLDSPGTFVLMYHGDSSQGGVAGPHGH